MAENNLGRNITFPIYYDTVDNGTATQHETGLVIHKATVETSVMSLGDKITGDVYYANNSLQVTMQEYIVYNDVRYILVSPPTIIREGMVSENGELKGMTKYSFVFYHPMYVLSNFPFSDVAVSEDEKRYLSENKVFSWIGKPQDFIDKLNKNLDGTEWVVVKSSNFPQDTEDELSDVLKFDNNTIADALKTGYETWGLPYVIDQIHQGEEGYSNGKRFKVIFGLPSNAIMDGQNEYVFRMGQGVGLKNNSRTPRNNKIVTRIAGYGSENNIPYGYPQIRWYGVSGAEFTYGDHAGVYENVTIGGRTFSKVVSYPIYKGILGGAYVELIKHPFTRNHLMPSKYRGTLFNKVSPYLANGTANSNYDPDIELVDYYDADSDSYPNQINPSSPSYEIHAFEDIKPELGEAEIVAVQPINKDGTTATGWDDTMDDDGNYLQSYFKITLPQLNFDMYACAAITEEMQINMRSGACIGCTFPVQVDWEDYKKNFYDDDGNFDPVIGEGHPRNASKYPDSSSGSITVIVQKEYSTFGVLMPNIYQQPASGDEFVILGISLPDTYVTSAEGRLDNEMRAYMLVNNIHYYDYPLKFDEYFLATHTNILSQIRTNTQVKFQFANEDPITLFVKQIIIKYGENVLPQYDITLTDSVEVVLNQIGKVADDVEKLSALVSVLRQSYNRNVWGEIAKKLSKTSNDTAQGEITFLQGLKIGSNGNSGIAPNGDATLNDVNVSGDLTITHTETPQGGAPVVKEYGITNDGDISGEGLEIGNFANSGLLGTGGAFKMVDGKSYLEADKLYVRMKAYFDTLEIRRYIHSGGNRVASAAGCKVSRVVGSSGGSFYRLCFKATDGDNTVTNDFTVGDFAYCHTTNLEGGELNQRNYWRLVMRYGSLNASRQIVSLNGEPVSGVEDTVVTEHFIDVANTTNLVDIGEEENYQGMMAGSTEPKAEDDVVQLGHAFDEDRQGAIIEAVTGAMQAPTYRIYQGIDSFNLENKCKVDMGYDLDTHRAYLNVSGDFYFGDNNSYVKFNSNTGVLDIKAKIDASSPVGNGGLTLYGYVNNIAGTAASTAENNAKEYADEKVGDYEYLKDALEDGETVIDGGLILTNLIALKNSGGNVTAGITGLSDANDIALWLGGLMADWESLTPQQQAVANRDNYAKSLFRFNGSGYLAGGNISWATSGNTEVKGTIRAKNLFHNVCVFQEKYRHEPCHYRDGGVYQDAGNADVVFMFPNAYLWHRDATNEQDTNVAPEYFLDARTLVLPPPSEYDGKVVEVFIIAKEDRENVGSDGYGAQKNISIKTTDLAPVIGSDSLTAVDGELRTMQEGWNTVAQVSSKAGYVRLLATSCYDTNGSNHHYAWVYQIGGGSGSGITNIINPTYVTYEGASEQWVLEVLNGVRDDTGTQVEPPITNWFAQKSEVDKWIAAAIQGIDTSNFLPLSAGKSKTLTDSLFISPNKAIKINDGSANGVDLLSFTSASGNTPAKWVLGTGDNGIIRSGGELIRKSGNSEYTIYDSSNLTPSNYLLKTDISSWAKAANKPTYNLDEVTDGSTRKLSNYATTSALAALNNTTVKLNVNNTMTGQNVFQGITTFQSNVFVSPNNTLYLQSYDEASRPIDSPAASQAWVGQQGYLTSADLRGYATTSELTTGLAWKQNLIHFLNTNNNNTAVSFSYLKLPLKNVASGYAELDVDADLGILKISSTLSSDVTLEHKTSGSNIRFFTIKTAAEDLLHNAGGTDYKIWDSRNLTQATINSFATQTWVQQQGYLTSHQSLANYVTLDGTQTITGAKTFSANVRLKNDTNYGMKLLFGDGEYCYLHEDSDDHLMIYARYGVNFSGGHVRFNMRPRVLTDSENNTYTNVALTSDLSGYATTSAWKVKDMQVVADNGLVFNGEDVIYDAELASNGMLTLKRTKLQINVPEYTSDLTNDSGFITQTTADGRYATRSQILDVQETMVTALGVSGDYLTWTAGGQTNNITVPFATRTMGFKRLSVTGSQTVDANTMTVGGVEYALLSNYADINLWSNMPSGMSWGNVLQLTSSSSLSGQLAWDVIHNSNTPTNRIWWRARNSTGWGNDWQQFVMYRNLGTGAVDTYAGTFAFGGNEALQAGYDYAGLQVGSDNDRWQITAIGSLRWRQNDNNDLTSAWQSWRTILDTSNWSSYVTGFLPLSAGSSHPLTGNIAYNGTKATYEMITFIDNTVDAYGNGIAIGGGGAAIIGGGESASVMRGQLSSGGNEVMYIGNDQGVSIFTNLQDGWANRKEFAFDINGDFSLLSGANGRKMRLTSGGGIYLTAGTSYWGNGMYAMSQADASLGEVGFFGNGETLTYMYIGAAYNNTWVVVKPNGNVGIGTTTPNYNLDVSGNFHASGNAIVDGSVLMGNVSSGIEIKYDRIDWIDRSGNSPWTMGAMMFHYDGNVSTDDVTVRFELRPQVLTGSNTYTNVALTTDIPSVPAGRSMYFGNCQIFTNSSGTAGTELYLSGNSVHVTSDGVFTFNNEQVVTSSGVAFASKSNNQWTLTVDHINTGHITATSFNFANTADSQGHGGSAISHVNNSSENGILYNAGTNGNHYFKKWNSSGTELYANIHCLTCDETSDIRQKEVVEYLNPSVYDIANAPIIKFRWIGGGNDLHLGSISQYWEKTLPETVHIGDDLMQSMEKSTIALLAGITSARKAVDNERRIAELELRVAELESQLNEITNNNINN